MIKQPLSVNKQQINRKNANQSQKFRRAWIEKLWEEMLSYSGQQSSWKSIHEGEAQARKSILQLKSNP